MWQVHSTYSPKRTVSSRPAMGMRSRWSVVDNAPVRASNGTRMLADITCEAPQQHYDVALVAGGPGLPSDPPDPRLSTWLRDVASRCERYGSICTGAFALGHAGLIDGRHVTTHWQNAPQLARQFPLARVELDRIHIRDGNLVTSAGVTAGIDVALALVAEDHGPRIALAVAKRLVVFAQRRGGQSQFSPYLSAPANETSPAAKVQAYVMEHIGERMTVEKLAQIAGMSERNFARAFVEATGVTHRAVPTDGVIPLTHILERVLTAGYANQFDLELIGPRIDAEGHLEAARRAALNVGKMLRGMGVH